ncbi:hypothetical protein FA95DRAFT_226181 [Auriscalpium vulgare]|uniref:Uncharacterized protein n=1 Tax=Auriscalpium vulgare TaxID=40419 RepID=A0ACB8RLP3_9AGAM|nr:hypothetical protein FA95DRAFT_226181 [Auriscalpium vulgare]
MRHSYVEWASPVVRIFQRSAPRPYRFHWDAAPRRNVYHLSMALRRAVIVAIPYMFAQREFYVAVGAASYPSTGAGTLVSISALSRACFLSSSLVTLTGVLFYASVTLRHPL